MNEARYYAMVLTMAEHLPMTTEAQCKLRNEALLRMTEAVSVERTQRGRCRDTDHAAAVRVRSRW